MSIAEIGCCGAYCKTCQAFVQQTCKGCKLGYDQGQRDLSKAKCAMKVCCINSRFQTCADCPKYEFCEIINGFYNKNGFKYGKYQEATEYIRKNGYEAFLKIADKWKNAQGKYK